MPSRLLACTMRGPRPSREPLSTPRLPPPPRPQMVHHMVQYEQQLREEVLLNIERLQAVAADGDDGDAAAGMQVELADAPLYEVDATGAQVTLENAQVPPPPYAADVSCSAGSTPCPLLPAAAASNEGRHPLLPLVNIKRFFPLTCFPM